MRDSSTNRDSLTEELEFLRRRVALLEQREAEFRFFTENMGDVAFIVNMELRTTYVSPSIEKVLGYTVEERINQEADRQLTPEALTLVVETFAAELEREKTEGSDKSRSLTLELEYYHKDGSIKCLETYIRGVRDHNGNLTGFYGLSRDITERKRMEEALRRNEERYRNLCIVDDLTQLYNSRYFYQQLRSEIDRVNRYGQPLTLLLLDLDNFKSYNDAYGHVEGDQVLLRLGQVIKRLLRHTDSAYRYGGEEFTVILPMTANADGLVIANRIQTELKKERFSPVAGQDIPMTLSIGVAQYRCEEEMKAFIHRVDKLMYQGKQNGKNQICFEP